MNSLTICYVPDQTKALAQYNSYILIQARPKTILCYLTQKAGRYGSNIPVQPGIVSEEARC